MESNEVIESRQERGWLWATLFVALGLFNIADYFYTSGVDVHRAMTGVGFLLIAPQTFLHPVRFTKPIWSQLKSSPRPTTALDWLAVIGIALLVLGLIARWL